MSVAPHQGYPPQGQPQPGCPPQQPVYAAPPAPAPVPPPAPAPAPTPAPAPAPAPMMNNTTIINNTPAPDTVEKSTKFFEKI